MVLVLCKPRLVGRKPDPTCIRSPPEPWVQTVICRAILYGYTLSGLKHYRITMVSISAHFQLLYPVMPLHLMMAPHQVRHHEVKVLVLRSLPVQTHDR